MRITEKDKKRFLSFVEKDENTGCWEWVGGKSKQNNRGSFWINGKTRIAYRVSYLIFNGEIPDGLYVCHSCDNPSCVNPNHLWIGTNSDNIKDAFSKGKINFRGENAPASKLSNKDVIEIRKLLWSKKYSQKDIAQIYGVSQSNISRINTKNTFTEI